MMTGFTALDRCAHGCRDAAGALLPSDRRQLYVPMAGLRYTYAYNVRSVRRNLRRRFLLEAYVDVFAPPLKAPAIARYLPNGDDAGNAGFGGRIGLELPPFGCLAQIVFGSGCLSSDVSIGYAPYPRFIYFKVQAGYPFY